MTISDHLFFFCTENGEASVVWKFTIEMIKKWRPTDTDTELKDKKERKNMSVPPERKTSLKFKKKSSPNIDI